MARGRLLFLTFDILLEHVFIGFYITHRNYTVLTNRAKLIRLNLQLNLQQNVMLKRSKKPVM